MDIVATLLPHLINGLALGLLFALIALGFTLIVSVMEVINLAHGSLFALGAYVAMVIISPDLVMLGAAGIFLLRLHGPHQHPVELEGSHGHRRDIQGQLHCGDQQDRLAGEYSADRAGAEA